MGRNWWRKDTFESLNLDSVLRSRMTFKKPDWFLGICDRCRGNTRVKDTSFRKLCKMNNWKYLCEDCRYELFGYNRLKDELWVSWGSIW